MIIFLIGTQHQFVQVLDVIAFLKCTPKDCILIFESNGKENKFINDLKENYSFQEVIVFDSWVFKDIFLGRKKINKYLEICYKIKCLNVIQFYYSHYDTDSTLLFLNIVKPVSCYLLDEGTASFSVAYYRRKKPNFNIKLFIKSLFYLKFLHLPINVNYFTKFNLAIQNHDTITFYSEKKITNTRYPICNNKLFFLGSSISDIGYMNEDDYLDLLLKIIEKYKYEIHYFSHRKESDVKLKRISSLGIKVYKNEIPFEKYFLQLTNWPEYLASFHFSNLLDTIISRYSEVPECLLFKFDKNMILKEKEVYENIFNHNCKNKKLNIVYI